MTKNFPSPTASAWASSENGSKKYGANKPNAEPMSNTTKSKSKPRSKSPPLRKDQEVVLLSLSQNDREVLSRWGANVIGAINPLDFENMVSILNRLVVAAMGEPKERMCVQCGCTDSKACPKGCSWIVTHPVTPTGVCSECWSAHLASFLEQIEGRKAR